MNIESVIVFCRTSDIQSSLLSVKPPERLTIAYRVISAVEDGVDDETLGALQQIVLSPDDHGIGAEEDECLVTLCRQGLKPLVFLFYPWLEDEDRDEVLAAATRRAQQHAGTVIHGGGEPQFNALLEAIDLDRDNLISARQARMACVEAARESLEAASTALALKSKLADYLNIRMECDSIIKAAKDFEGAIDAAYVDSLQRLNESSLTTRLQNGLLRLLPADASDQWLALAPPIASDISMQWQADQINNMLQDIKRFYPISIDIQQRTVEGGLQLSAELQPTSGFDLTTGLLRTGSSAALASTFVAMVAPIAFLAIPAALAVGAFMWNRTREDGNAAARARFVGDLSPYLLDASRASVLTTRRLLKSACDSAKEHLRNATQDRISDLLKSERAMSDNEAAEIARQLQQLSPAPL